jgi:RNA polymerase sigma-70 factor (ECF subfamily)
MKATLRIKESRNVATSPLLALSDEELLVQYRETGERKCFAELVSRYERELYSYLKRYLGSTEAAEDAFQASFLQVHLKADQFEPERRFRPWVYAIATNQAIDAQRRNRRTRTVSLDGIRGRGDRSDAERPVDWMVSPEPNPTVEVDRGERKELMRRAVEQLSDQMRTVIHLVYYQGLKYREAAEVMAVPVGTIKSRLHTAIAKLTEFWNHHHAEAD